MLKKDIKKIVATYYEALEEGKILGRKCTKCGHVEFPPYLACNACGNLDTEWVELGGTADCNQILPAPVCFMEPDLKDRVGDYWHGAVQVPDSDELGTILININPAKINEARSRLPIKVRPVITQDIDVKAVYWEPVDDDLRMTPVIKTVLDPADFAKLDDDYVPAEGESKQTKDNAATAIDPSDPVAQIVMECAAEAYGVDVSELSMSTDIREDLSSESMKMIVMISGIEDELDVTIEIQEASNLNTLADFALRVKEKMSE